MGAAFLQGFGVGAGLIAAIGAQNVFVLAQGVRKNHHLVVALICIGCDAVLISAGVGGLGGIVAASSWLTLWMTRLGAAFLAIYGLFALCSAVRGGGLSVDDRPPLSRKAAVGATLAVTLLNPHVYLDTVVLLGSVSSGLRGSGRWLFWGGAVCASVLWFLSLSLGGRLLAPIFRSRRAWRVLDILVCGVMWTIAWSLLSSGGGMWQHR
jgi:L-lysine exporter family protein LysE/ArgO